MGRRAALVVGIDDHDLQHKRLQGCVADAERVGALLAKHEDGSPSFKTRYLVNPQRIERWMLLSEIDRLFRRRVHEAVLYFAGHGDTDARGGYLVAQDSKCSNSVVRSAEILAMANASRIPDIVILLDCCGASSMGLADPGDARAMLRDGITIITAAQDHEVAQHKGRGGLFTDVLCAALEGGAADVRGEVNVASAFAYINESLGPHQQRPELKTHVADLITLRRCTPRISDATLRRLPEWFSVESSEYPLSPAHEPTEEPRNSELEEIFGKLQRCRHAGLVVPVRHEHMYDEAMKSGACRLTPLGRHYRRLAARGEL